MANLIPELKFDSLYDAVKLTQSMLEVTSSPRYKFVSIRVEGDQLFVMGYNVETGNFTQFVSKRGQRGDTCPYFITNKYGRMLLKQKRDKGLSTEVHNKLKDLPPFYQTIGDLYTMYKHKQGDTPLEECKDKAA